MHVNLRYLIPFKCQNSCKSALLLRAKRTDWIEGISEYRCILISSENEKPIFLVNSIGTIKTSSSKRHTWNTNIVSVFRLEHISQSRFCPNCSKSIGTPRFAASNQSSKKLQHNRWIVGESPIITGQYYRLLHEIEEPERHWSFMRKSD